MPIPQDRLIRVLEAAEEYNRLYDSLWSKVNEICLNALAHQLPLEQVANQILIAARRPERLAYLTRSIQEERARLTLTYKKNTYERERLRAKRAGVPFKTWMQHIETRIEVGEPVPSSDYLQRQMNRATRKAAAIVEDLTEQADLRNLLPPHDSLGPDDSDIDFDRLDEDDIKRKGSEIKAAEFERLKSLGKCKEGDLMSCRWPTCNCED